MQNSPMKRHIKTALALCSIAGATFPALAGETHWIGGDTLDSGAQDTFAVDENWDAGVAPTISDSSTSIVIDQNGAGVIWRTATGNPQTTYNAPVVIGADSDPSVTVVLKPQRHWDNPTNDDPGMHYFASGVTVTGANTRVVISRGAGFHHNGTVQIDPRSQISGEGIFRVAEKLAMPGRDYGDLTLYVGRNSQADTYVLEGDATTSGPLWLTATDRGRGVDSVVTLDLDGHTLSVGSVRLGRLDWQTQAQFTGNQSGFGSVLLNGGTLAVSGDITSLADADGVGNDTVTPLQNQDKISSGGAGGTIRLGGSFKNLAVRGYDGWHVEDVALVFCGDGTSTQEFEALSADLGKKDTACLSNFAWKSLTVESGAAVKLVDTADNSRGVAGVEAVYVGDLVVESGATLDLNGLNVYYYGQASIDGTITGGSPVPLSARPVSVIAYTLDHADPSTGHGMWVGQMAVGDIDGDGRNELLLATTDNDPADDDGRIHALKLSAAGTITEASGFPVSDSTLGFVDSGASSARFGNFIVDDLGDGHGRRLFYHSVGYYSKVGAVSAGAVADYAVPNAAANALSWAGNTYGWPGFALVDLNRDNVKDIVYFGRTNPNLLALDGTDGSVMWQATAENAGAPLSSGCVADLDGDGSPEIIAVGTRKVFSAVRSDGSAYTSPGGTAVTSLPLPNEQSEDFGAASAADLTGDGVADLVFSDAKSGRLQAMTQDGSLLFTLTCQGAATFHLLDVDKDGDYELLYGGKLYNGSGSVLQTLPVPVGAVAYAPQVSPALADFNGDQVPEVAYVCTMKVGNSNLARILNVYDFVSGETLGGFPVTLQAPDVSPDFASLWYSGSFTYWNASHLLIADLDGSGTWQILAGTGVANARNNPTSDPATLNIVRTPYHYDLTHGRTAEEIGWCSVKHGPLLDSRYPLARKVGTVVLFR